MTRFSIWTVGFAMVAATICAGCSPQFNLSQDAANGDLAAVQRDLANKVDPNTSVGDDPVLFAAVRSGRLDVVEALLNAGADVNARDKTLGNTALMIAAGHHNDLIKPLVAAGAHIDAQNNIGQSALLNAVILNDPDTVQALLDAGADVNTPFAPSGPPILAVFKDQPKYAGVVQVLVQNGGHT
jgi:ankyrin repeat protein